MKRNWQSFWMNFQEHMNNILGFDVSIYDDDSSTPQHVNFQQAKNNGIEFVYIKSSQGNYSDRDILINWENARIAELLRGAYHFLTWDVKPEEQAKFMFGLLKNDPGELPLMVDFEWWKVVPADAIKKLWAFLVEIKSLLPEKKIGIYTNNNFWKEFGQFNIEWSQFLIWLAQYKVLQPDIPKPWTRWDVWQYTERGAGIKYGCESKMVDLNLYNGSYEDLLKLAGKVNKPVEYKNFMPLITKG
jgi:lysozyme